MGRKRLTQCFPWLLPLRKWQRRLCFYAKMKLDGNRYAKSMGETLLPFLQFQSTCPLYNQETGFPMLYQENKVFNLKLAAATLHKILIRPGETFSLWQLLRYADRRTPYKDGLAVSDGTLTTMPGGGLCQISNLLFWLFLHSPLTIIERHCHGKKEFPEPPSDTPFGVDATVLEGWLDLKVKNCTSITFQLAITFTSETITGQFFTDTLSDEEICISNGTPLYYRQNGKLYEEVDILQNRFSRTSGELLSAQTLYRNHCEIAYPLPVNTEIEIRS